MFWLHSSLLVLCATLVIVSYADLISSFTQDNITFLAPGQDGYSVSSTACKSFDSFSVLSSHDKLLILTVNLRFSFNPAAITFPNTAQDVSTILQIAQEFNYSVAARSGGVRLFVIQHQSYI